MEVWKTIKNYENLYEISNYGRVKSLRRGIILKPGKTISKKKIGRRGYYFVNLVKNKKLYSITIHRLVAEAFLNHTSLGTHEIVIDHIDNNPFNNNVNNLQLLTNRQNCTKDPIKGTSNYMGVYYKKDRNKWNSQIKFNNEVVYLGTYLSEKDAHLAYEKARIQVENNIKPNIYEEVKISQSS